MRALHLLVLLAILYFVHGSPSVLSIPSGIGMKPDGLDRRIVNGTKAALKQFPHQVSLLRSWSKNHFCGGNLISSSLVLTAAHCMYLSGSVVQPWTIIVLGGVLNLYDETPTRQEIGVTNIRIHSAFDLENLYNDVAVLQLLTPFVFSPEVRSVSLLGKPPATNTVCQVAGWGYLSSSNQTVSSDLMFVDLPIRSREECSELLENVTDVPTGMFCAGYLEGGRDSCQGDSGGGMVCNGILTGIVSGGQGCAEPLLPGVYTEIPSYLDFILRDANVVTVVTTFGDAIGIGTLNTPKIMIMLISFLLCTVINYT